MSSTTTHLMNKLLPVCQSLTKGVGFSVFEGAPMKLIAANGLNREAIPVT
jgi:hypothetical protein